MASGPDYVFTRDYLDNNRINLQHYLWRQLFGYLTHPKIPTDNPNIRIADVGTGTGIWLTDIGAQLPSSVQLDGLDISFDATPPPSWLPPNVRLQHWDIKEDVPDDLAGKFDIVNIRHFCFVFKNDDIQPVLKNLVRLLKPGGYLQWGDPDISSFRIEKTDPKNKDDALTKLVNMFQGHDARLRPTWVSDLPRHFSEAGLEDVESDVKDAPPHLAIALHDCSIMMNELVMRKIQNEDALQRLKNLMLEVGKETREGSCWAATRWTVIGRKPASEEIPGAI
ncbi:S-adenosyl-L-methionine-dependent methyltransferase [Biscogniauxia marginata]|nr:S-adenosyl-L-methionine-dependent methyltransferase [Biscogniauxia marginata]